MGQMFGNRHRFEFGPDLTKSIGMVLALTTLLGNDEVL
jgi:hypothetical protein